ncbi:ATP-binding protein [Daejeonia sp. YH14]|uniref:ATP-binding protein n=1 Tax=Daejeonia sp. YH14 TaxID=3439042 RepID=UPI003F497095
MKNNLVILEMSNLNKQLDPHEIKNLIANISPEIQEKAPESYRKMLKLFNITKAALNNNSITDSIKNQTLQIDDFLGLEKQMLTVPLHYSIENNIQNPELQIPRLMLKNLVENAVKHGIKGNENGGTIHVALTEKAGFINIVVDDTGKGRKNAIAQDSGIGTSTYQNLFATLNMKNKEHASFEITDKKEGTKVVVVIPKEYKYE